MKKLTDLANRIKNSKFTPKDVIVDQMQEARPLPMGRSEFAQWSDRIIAGALIAGVRPPSEILEETPTASESEYEAFINAQKNALANMLMHIGPTESHKPDAYFIHALRVGAVKQVAWAISTEFTKAAKARTKALEEAKAKEEGLSEGD